MKPLPQTIQPTTSPPQSRAKGFHISHPAVDLATKGTEVVSFTIDELNAANPEPGTEGIDDLTVSLGKTVDCIVSSEGEYGSTTIQSTTSASRTALFLLSINGKLDEVIRRTES